MFGLLRCT
jgi:hypothetical protein